MPQVIAFIERYATVIAAPVETHTTVTSVRASDGAYVVATDRDTWHCSTIVLASGACNIAHIPEVAAGVSSSIMTITSMAYRNPDQLPQGGVLVVGASATGTQLADEIHRSGRPVTIAVGEHIRAPRVYRGKDIQWWMDVAGIQDMSYREVDDIIRACRVPSLQLAGSTSRAMLDLNALGAMGVKLVARLEGLREGKAQFSGSLRNQCALSDLKMNRLLKSIDEWATANDLDDTVDPPHRLPPTEVPDDSPLMMDLARAGIRAIVWASGYLPDHSWLHVPVLDRKGRIQHNRGVVASPGMYQMGMQFLRRRKSALIDGAGDDARDLSDHLVQYLAR